MKTKISLDAKSRQVQGSKVKQLRREGILPANVFGKGIKSVAIELDEKAFLKVLDEAGETSIVYLNIDDQKPRPVLIGDIHYNPLTEGLFHVDLRQVSLKEKIVTHVPISLIGESSSVKEFGATIVEGLEEIEVEALPTDLPESVEIDISVLVNVGDSITVGDLKLGSEIEILTDPSIVVASAQVSRQEEEETEDAGELVEAETTEQAKPESDSEKAESKE